MQLFALPARIEGLIFDIDKTLYDDAAYAAEQISMLIERLAQEWGRAVSEVAETVRLSREHYAAEHGGAQQSLGNVFLSLGIPIETSVRWREELIRPRDRLSRDPLLAESLAILSRRFRMVAVTNNPRSVGVESLAALGADESIREVVGLDTTWASKPSPEPFVAAAELLGCDPGTVVSIGDRYDVDIAPALKLGMGGIQVDSVAEVYRLPGILADRGSLDAR